MTGSATFAGDSAGFGCISVLSFTAVLRFVLVYHFGCSHVAIEHGDVAKTT